MNEFSFSAPRGHTFIFIIQYFIYFFFYNFLLYDCMPLLVVKRQKYAVCILKKLEDICEVLVLLNIYYR
jgi:hypothetical protein